MGIASNGGDILVTHALGSCLGVAAHDPVSGVGGLVHLMLPESRINPDKARANPYMFVDCGIPKFMNQLYARGAQRSRIVVKVAGGANVNETSNDRFAIGKRNYLTLRKLFWKSGLMIKAEDVGGSKARTMYLQIGDGRVWLSTGGVEKEL
jgi:chemotaxis protein CheD